MWRYGTGHEKEVGALGDVGGDMRRTWGWGDIGRTPGHQGHWGHRRGHWGTWGRTWGSRRDVGTWGGHGRGHWGTWEGTWGHGRGREKDMGTLWGMGTLGGTQGHRGHWGTWEGT